MKRRAALQGLAQGALGCALIVPTGAANAGPNATKIEGLRETGLETPQQSQDLLGRGKFHLRSGDVPLALEMYRRALGRDPNSVEALNGIAVCYDRLGKYDVSRTYYETALGIDPQSPMLLNNYGYSLLLQGDHAGARRFLSLAAASGDPDAAGASLRLLARLPAATPQLAEAPPIQPRPRPRAEPATAMIVRTSSHEQRLVLGGEGAGPAMMVATLGEAASAMVAVPAVSQAQDQAIAAQDVRFRQAELLAAAKAARAELAAASEVAWPAALRALVPEAPLAPANPAIFAGIGATRRADRPTAPSPDRFADFILATARAPVQVGDRNGPLIAALPSGLLVQRQGGARPPKARTLPAAEPLARKRQFEAPFQSDDADLNGFAAQVHGHAGPPDTAAQVALLEQLIERMRTA